jgi:hypothetical protein
VKSPESLTKDKKANERMAKNDDDEWRKTMSNGEWRKTMANGEWRKTTFC